MADSHLLHPLALCLAFGLVSSDLLLHEIPTLALQLGWKWGEVRWGAVGGGGGGGKGVG